MGIVLHVVVADETGAALISGAPKLRIVRTHHFGGLVDTKALKPFICGPSLAPRIWYCSEDQALVLLSSSIDQPGTLVYGSEGAGKTSVLAMWHVLRVLSLIGERKEGGQTAPTEARLAMIRTELVRICPSEWFRYQASKDMFTFCDGTRLRLVSTHRKSLASGSPIQGYNWSWCGQDEGQDQIDARDDIESRGRSAYGGHYYQMMTATAKDDSYWRNTRDKLVRSGLWQRHTMLGPRSPFVHAKFWDEKKRTMDPQQYARRIECQDLGNEFAVYHGWVRERNLIKLSTHQLDLTTAVLQNLTSRFGGGGFTLLAGHDPGQIYNTTTFFKMMMHNANPTWFVVGELQTKQVDNHAHAQAINAYVQQHFGTYERDGTRLAIYCDPHGKGDAMTDYQTVYTAMHKNGLDVFTPSHDRISRKKRVAMMNRLMADSSGYVNLCVALNDQHLPCAPLLVDAFESLEKDPAGRNAEGMTRKDATDKTHAPASAGYAMWPFERELITNETRRMAMEFAKKIGWRP